jgi:hypothetical protein
MVRHANKLSFVFVSSIPPPAVSNLPGLAKTIEGVLAGDIVRYFSTLQHVIDVARPCRRWASP